MFGLIWTAVRLVAPPLLTAVGVHSIWQRVVGHDPAADVTGVPVAGAMALAKFKAEADAKGRAALVMGAAGALAAAAAVGVAVHRYDAKAAGRSGGRR